MAGQAQLHVQPGLGVQQMAHLTDAQTRRSERFEMEELEHDAHRFEQSTQSSAQETNNRSVETVITIVFTFSLLFCRKDLFLTPRFNRYTSVGDC